MCFVDRSRPRTAAGASRDPIYLARADAHMQDHGSHEVRKLRYLSFQRITVLAVLLGLDPASLGFAPCRRRSRTGIAPMAGIKHPANTVIILASFGVGTFDG